jgi:hypothetical protein
VPCIPPVLASVGHANYAWSMTECCLPPPFILPPQADRLPLIREAFRLEWLTIGWMTVEAVVAILSRDNLGENGGGDQNGKRRPVAAL